MAAYSRKISMRGLLKIAGLAGAVGVAASGVLVARNERQRRRYEPDEVRERLHQRLAVATADRNTVPRERCRASGPDPSWFPRVDRVPAATATPAVPRNYRGKASVVSNDTYLAHALLCTVDPCGSVAPEGPSYPRGRSRQQRGKAA